MSGVHFFSYEFNYNMNLIELWFWWIKKEGRRKNVQNSINIAIKCYQRNINSYDSLNNINIYTNFLVHERVILLILFLIEKFK